MKQLLKLALIVCLQLPLFINAQDKNVSTCLDPDIPAHFIYDEAELNEFISNNLIVPHYARYHGINGDVELQYIVDTLGGIGDVKVKVENIDLGAALYLRDAFGADALSGFFSSEGIRVIQLLSGLYEPAIKNGIKVQSALSMTLYFKTKQYDENYRQVRMLKASQSKDLKFWSFGIYTKEEPDYAALRYNIGVQKLQEKKYDLASRYFEEAIRFKPDYLDAIFNLGITYTRLLRFEDACKMWSKAKELGDEEASSIYEEHCD